MKKSRLVGCLFVTLLAGKTIDTHAAIDYWDPEGAVASPTTTQLTATWTSSSANWSASSSGGSLISLPSANAACFCSGTTAPSGSFTVTVSGTVTCAGLFNGPFNPPGFNVILSGGTINLGSGTPGVCAAGSDGDPLIINSVLAGTGQVIIEGTDQITLNGVNTYSGGTSLGLSTAYPNYFSNNLVNFNNGSAFGTGTFTLTAYGNGSALVPSVTTALTVPNNFSISSSPTGGLTNNFVGNSGGVTYSGNWSLGANRLWFETGSSAGDLDIISGIVSGSLGLVIADSGTLELTGVNTYTGNTGIISPAVFTIGVSGSLGSGSYGGNITNGGTFNYSSSATQTLSGTISGAGPLNQTAGSLTLSGANTYTGKTTIDNGLLAISADNGLGADPGSATAGNLTLNNTSTGNYGLRCTASFTLNANRGISLGSSGGSIQVASGDTLTYGGIIAGSAGLMCGTSPTVGEGILILSGANTYTGATSIAAGTLQLGASGSLPSGTALTVASAGVGGIFNLNNLNQTIGSLTSSTGINGTGTTTPTVELGTGTLTVDGSSSTTFAGVISGSGSLVINGAGALALLGADTYTVGTTVEGGATVSITNDSGLGNTSATLTLNNGCLKNDGTSGTPTLSSSRSISLGSSGGYIDAGWGTFGLTGANISPITIDSKITGSGQLCINMDGSPVVLVNTANNFTGGISIGTNGPSYYASGSCAWLQMGAAGVIPNGSGYGNVTINATYDGYLDLNGYNQTINGLSGTGSITNSSGSATLTVGGNNATSTFSGAIVTSATSQSGTVALTKIGTGTLTLSGASYYTGATTISAGTLLLGSGGSISDTPTISIAASATLDVSASGITLTGSSPQQTLAGSSTSGTAMVNAPSKTVTLSSGALLSFQAAGGGSSTVGEISVAGTSANLTLNGNAVTVNVTGSALAAGTYRLMACTGTLTGTANSTPTITGTALSSGYTATVSTTTGAAGHVDLIVNATPAFSGLTSSPSITYGATSVTLNGTVSSTSGPTTVYAANGDTVTATINGHAVNGTVSGGAGGFTITYNNSSLATDGVGSSPYIITYAYAGNSAVFLNAAANNTSTSLTVNKAIATVTATAQSKTYGQTVTFGSGSTLFTSSTLSNSETIGSVTLAVSANGGAASAQVSGSPYTITPSAATGGSGTEANYNITYVTGLLTVNPATLTVTADDFSQPYGATNPVFTASYTNFVNGEVLSTSDVAGSPALSTTATTNTPVGTNVITITIGTLTSTNYSFNLVDGSLIITNAISTNVVSSSANPVGPGTNLTLTATLSTLAPSLAVPYGSVQFQIDGSPFGGPITLTNGVASTNTSSLSRGFHTNEVDYVGDTNILGSTNTLVELVDTPPVAGLATFSRQQNTSLLIAISDLMTNTSDVFGDTLALVAVSATSTNGATISTNSSWIYYTPPGTNGNVTDAFCYTVADIYGLTSSNLVVITLQSPYNGPSVNITGISTNGNGTVTISFAGIPNLNYLIQATTNLTSPITWTTLSTNMAGTNGQFSYTDLCATNYSSRYYRTSIPSN